MRTLILAAIAALLAGCLNDSPSAPKYQHCTPFRTDTLLTSRTDTITVAMKICT